MSNILKKDDIVIFESTVFPGATEEICVPILEEGSSMKINKGFTVGYSPERINVGDNIHTLENVRKIVSGSTPHARDVIANVYFVVNLQKQKMMNIYSKKLIKQL